MGGQRGPAPKPTALKKLLGNPGKRKLNEAEPIPRTGLPHCPDHLDPVAQKEWNRLLAILTAMRVLTEADYIALANLCQAYSTLIAAQVQLNKTGILYKTKSGYVQQSPLLGIITAQTTIVNNLLREFGLTPSSRTRIVAAPPPPEEDDDLAKLAAKTHALFREKLNAHRDPNSHPRREERPSGTFGHNSMGTPST